MKKVFFLPILSGCGTVISFIVPNDVHRQTGVYSGIKIDVAFATDAIQHGPVTFGLWALCDIPLSLLLDTALLPITILLELSR